MNFNRDLIHNLESKNLSRTMSEVKSTVGKVADELSSNTSKDISKGVAAEDAMGRASFSMMNKVSQTELSQKVNILSKKLGFENSSSSYNLEHLKSSCSNIDGTLNDKYVSLAEKFYKLADKKDDSLKFVWEGYIPDMVEQCKNADGTVNNEIKDSIEQLLHHDKVSVRGIPEIISGCTNLKQTRDGRYINEFDKKTFDQFSAFMDMNGKSMAEKDDVFTLYLGRTLKGCKRLHGSRGAGEDIFVDNVAFNFAKKLYEQGEDILDMEMFLNSFATQEKKIVNGSSEYFSTGFDFSPNMNESWAKKMLENLKTSIGNKEIIEHCKVDGKDNFHNLLTVDTLKKSGLYDDFGWSYDTGLIIDALKNDKGLIPTDKVTYFLKNPSEYPLNDVHDINDCLNSHGMVNALVLDKVKNGKIYSSYLDKCRVNGEFNYDNLDVLEHLQNHILSNGEKYNDYQIKEVLSILKNGDGVVDKKLMPYLDDLTQITHLSPEILKECITAKGDVDKALLDFQKELISKKVRSFNGLPSICKKEDGTANIQGINAVKSMLDADLGINSVVLHTFEKNKEFDYQGLKDFVQEYSKADKQFRQNVLNLSIVGEYKSAKDDTRIVDINLFKSMLDTMSKPDIAPLMKSDINATIVKAKTHPSSFASYSEMDLLRFACINKNDIQTLEKYGYPAKFFKEFGKDSKHFIETKKDVVNHFDSTFTNGTEFENKLKLANITDDVIPSYTRENLTEDVQKILENISESDRNALERVFKINIGENGIEGFPQRFDTNTIPPTGLETEFKNLNTVMNKFYSSEVQTNKSELKSIYEDLSSGFPEFKMIIGKTNELGERIDTKILNDLKTLVSAPEYQNLSPEDKSVAKMTVMLKNLEHIDSNPKIVRRSYSSDNDGLEVKISAEWQKSAEYANEILDRYNMSAKDKYRTVQLLNDVGWSKKLAGGELNNFDIAVNQRYKGDEVVSPLVEKVLTGNCKYDKSAVSDMAKQIHKNQEVLLTSTIEDFAPYIEKTIINGKELKYVDLNRPELQDKPVLAHFLGYDNNFHTLNMLNNKAYRSSFSASLINAGQKSSCFAGRNEGLVFEFDNVNVANTHYMNIESGFGKQYDHLKESMKSSDNKDIKKTVMKELNLSEDEYGELMEQIVHSDGFKDIGDCIINGKKLAKDDIINAHKLGVSDIIAAKGQNETTVTNARPFATIAIGENLNDYDVCKAVAMAQYNDIPLLFKKISRA